MKKSVKLYGIKMLKDLNDAGKRTQNYVNSFPQKESKPNK